MKILMGSGGGKQCLLTNVGGNSHYVWYKSLSSKQIKKEKRICGF